jgi:hypothetical protein
MDKQMIEGLKRVMAELEKPSGLPEFAGSHCLRWFKQHGTELLALLAAQPSGSMDAVRQRDKLICESIIANQYFDPNDYGRMKIDCEIFLHYFNQRKNAALQPSGEGAGDARS